MSDAVAAPPPAPDPLLGWEVGNQLQQPWLHRVLASVVALVIAWLLWRLVLRGVTTLCRRSTMFGGLEPLILRCTRWVYWLLALLFILQQAGVDTASLWTAITATTALVAVGFIAVWSMLSNLVASLLILGSRLFKPRDEVELVDGGNSVRGRVSAINLMFTVLEEQHAEGPPTQLKIPTNPFFQKVLRVRPET
jgi:small-conductance mechanosensitive channel